MNFVVDKPDNVGVEREGAQSSFKEDSLYTTLQNQAALVWDCEGNDKRAITMTNNLS